MQHTKRKKIKFLTELSRFCAAGSEPLLIGGDFNIVRNSSEKNNNSRVQ